MTRNQSIIPSTFNRSEPQFGCTSCVNNYFPSIIKPNIFTHKSAHHHPVPIYIIDLFMPANGPDLASGRANFLAKARK